MQIYPQKILLSVFFFFSVLLCYLLFKHLLGAMFILFSVFALLTSKYFVTFWVAFLSILLGVALNYYQWPAHPNYLFYRNNGSTISELCVVLLVFLFMFYISERGDYSKLSRKVYVHKINIQFHPITGLLCTLGVVASCAFVLINAGTFFSKNFDLESLGRYAFLEYVSIMIIASLLAVTKNGFIKKISFSVAFLYFLLLLLASYRMAALINFLAIFIVWYGGREISKVKLIAAVFLGFLAMGSIGYLRAGIVNFTLFDILGYKDTYKYGEILDNTFTGVIETSLIYTAYADSISFLEKLKILFAIVVPLPSSILPTTLDYHTAVKLFHDTRVPGGGTVGGYIIMTNYLLSVPLALYLMYSQSIYRAISYHDHSPRFKYIIYAISVFSLPRWYLYGPYVLFKFLGFMLIILFMDKLIRYLFPFHALK